MLTFTYSQLLSTRIKANCLPICGSLKVSVKWSIPVSVFCWIVGCSPSLMPFFRCGLTSKPIRKRVGAFVGIWNWESNLLMMRQEIGQKQTQSPSSPNSHIFSSIFKNPKSSSIISLIYWINPFRAWLGTSMFYPELFQATTGTRYDQRGSKWFEAMARSLRRTSKNEQSSKS